MVSIVESVFWINSAFGILLIMGTMYSVMVPEKRIWPPPSKSSWQYKFVWGLCYLWLFAGIGLFILDWNPPSLSSWIIYPLGFFFIIFGNIFAFWGMKTLSTHQTLGLKGVFINKGPYRFTRNPQYIGDITILIGFIIISGSLLVLISFGLAIIWFVITPFCEEPWLRNQYGEDYINYTKKVNRYFGFRT